METFFVFKVSIPIFAPEILPDMKEKILEKAMDMYLKLGFKSVTMDDIAQDMGISKKTIYQHYANKTDLVTAVAQMLINKISCDIDTICAEKHNAIKELFEIRRYLKTTLDDEYMAPVHQLNKYYPEVALSLKSNQFDKMHESVKDNLRRGIEEGLYRPEIDTEFISRIYFVGVTGIKEATIFPDDMYTKLQTTKLYLEYHIRAVSTLKGVSLLEEYLKES